MAYWKIYHHEDASSKLEEVEFRRGTDVELHDVEEVEFRRGTDIELHAVPQMGDPKLEEVAKNENGAIDKGIEDGTGPALRHKTSAVLEFV